jgi:hypothetical protein
MTMRAVMAASLLAMASFAAAAQPAPPAPAAAPSGGTDSDYATRRICRVTPANGSRLGGTRTCRTRAEWEEYQREARLTTDRIQRVSPPCMMGPNEPGHAHLVCSN